MTIEQRVAKLERQNCWMRRVGAWRIAAVACLLVGAVAAQDVSDGTVKGPQPVEGGRRSHASADDPLL